MRPRSYIQLATLFRRRIDQGAWRLDHRIPTVDILAQECGVARATIRQALDMLEQDGLIERFRAKGTFVRGAPAANRLWCDMETDWSGLLRSRGGAEIGRPAPLYRHIRRRHWRDGQPFLLADVYLNERLSPKVGAEALRSRTALKLVAGTPASASPMRGRR